MKYCKQTRQTPPRLAKKSVADFNAKADSRANSQITLNAAALTPSRLLDDPSYTGNNMDITHPAVEEHDQAKQSSSQPLPSNPLTAYYADTTSSSSSQPLSKKRKTNTGQADVAGKRTIHETKLLLIIMRHERDAQLNRHAIVCEKWPRYRQEYLRLNHDVDQSALRTTVPRKRWEGWAIKSHDWWAAAPDILEWRRAGELICSRFYATRYQADKQSCHEIFDKESELEPEERSKYPWSYRTYGAGNDTDCNDTSISQTDQEHIDRIEYHTRQGLSQLFAPVKNPPVVQSQATDSQMLLACAQYHHDVSSAATAITGQPESVENRDDSSELYDSSQVNESQMTDSQWFTEMNNIPDLTQKLRMANEQQEQHRQEFPTLPPLDFSLSALAKILPDYPSKALESTFLTMSQKVLEHNMKFTKASSSNKDDPADTF